MTTLYFMLTAVLGLSGAVMIGMTLLHRSRAGQGLHLRETRERPISDRQFRLYAMTNGTLSVALVYGMTWALDGIAFGAAPVGWPRVALEGAGVLFVFDLMYYLLHRFPFHQWRLLRRFHAVHHAIKTPTALDSLYQHPLENTLGLMLLWLAALIVAASFGPISVYSFAWAFLVYSILNVVIHSGLKFERFPLSFITYLGERHYRHHKSMKAKNYASITPVFDLMFGTEEA